MAALLGRPRFIGPGAWWLMEWWRVRLAQLKGAPTRRGQVVFVDTVWLVCRYESGRWIPRQDLPPAFDQAAAAGYAREQTRMSGQRHEARPFTGPKS